MSSITPTLAIAVKDLRLLLRDRMGLFFVVAWPLLCAVLMGYVMGGSGNREVRLKVGVVDEDQTAESQRFAHKLLELDELSGRIMARQQAERLVRQGKLAAFVLLKPGFAQWRKNMFWHWERTGGVLLGVDPSRRAEAAQLQGIIMRELMRQMQSEFRNGEEMSKRISETIERLDQAGDLDAAFRDSLKKFLSSAEEFFRSLPQRESENSGESAAWQPLRIETQEVVRERHGPQNAFEISFPQGMIWGLLACSAMFAVSWVAERRRQTLFRMMAAPVGPAHILAGKVLACWLATLAVCSALTGLGVAAFHLGVDSPALLLITILCISLCFVGIMMGLSVLGRTERSASGLAWMILLLMAMVGGGMMPLFIMPPLLQAIGTISPIKWSILAIEGCIWRGFSARELLVPWLILLGFALAGFAIGLVGFRYRQQAPGA